MKCKTLFYEKQASRFKLFWLCEFNKQNCTKMIDPLDITAKP